MNKKFRYLLVAIVVGMVFLGLTLSLVATPSPQTANYSGTEGALSAERLEMYNSLLAKSLRDEAYFIAPREDTVYQSISLSLGADASKAEIQAAVDQYYADFYANNNKVSRPNPYARIGRQKALELARNQGTPSQLTGNPQLLTVMMNFGGVQTFDTSQDVVYNGLCLSTDYPPTFTFTVDGPQFNEISQPSDNWTPWLDPDNSYTDGFTQEYFDLLMFSTTGYTEPMRTELANPWDGGNGFDFSGVSFKNWYLENSRGVYDPGGEVAEVTLPEAVSYFGAADCSGPIPQGDSFFGPVYNVAISAAEQINVEIPNFDWTAWDQEDVIDYDNDGNFNEPDGYVDHFFLIEAGQAQGGIYGEFMIWPHSWDVNSGGFGGEGPVGNALGGYQVSSDGPMGGVWILNYTVSDEVGGLGVLVHEYGHDIGLPDNYAYDGSGANTGFWDQMSSGTFGGALSGMHPTHHTIWDKSEPYLGWNDPVEVEIDNTTAVGEENALYFYVGQQSKPPAGAIDGLRLVLPDKESIAFVQPFAANMWWSDQGDDRSESIARTFTPAAGEDITVTTQLAYDIEFDWDYLIWEYSTDGGSSWTAIPVFDAIAATEVTTNSIHNGNNPDMDPVISGFSGDWISATATIDAAAHGGNELIFRFRYFTDAAVQNEGVYLDNISIDGAVSGNIIFDDAESGDTWTHMSEGLNQNAPWRIFDGVLITPHSYLVEWRNSGEGSGFNGVSTQAAFATAGFDIGLNRMYWIDEFDAVGNIAHIDPFFVHTPGMLVWYANGTYSDNNVGTYLFDDPSWGAKGRVLLVDNNPDPYNVIDALGTRQVGERRSSFDAAFTLDDRPAMTLSSNLSNLTDTVTIVPGAEANPVFRDRIGSAPGVIGSFFIDFDHGVVLPTRDNVPYWNYWDIFGDLGNPGLNAFGVNLEVVEQGHNGTWARIKFWMDDDSVFMTQKSDRPDITAGSIVTYTIDLKDASGSRYEDSHQHLFDAVLVATIPDGATLIPGSLTVIGNGTVYSSTAPATDLQTEVGTLSLEGNNVVWSGILGGNRLHELDAQVQFAVSLSADPGCYTSSTQLIVPPKMITDTFRNNGDLFSWPKNVIYNDSVGLCTPIVYLPVVNK